MKPDQDIVVAGNIGQFGTKVLIQEKEEELKQWFSKRYIQLLQSKKEVSVQEIPEDVNFSEVTEWEPVEEGGIFAALWVLSGRHEIGIEFELTDIPIWQGTIEVCERYELNPYRFLSGNCFLLISDHGFQTISKLKKLGIPCAVIGKVNSGIKREVYHGEEQGFLERPRKDELKKVVPAYFKNKIGNLGGQHHA